MSGFFYNLGRKVGRRAVPTLRKSGWIWKGLTGTEEEARRAERALGEALAVEVRTAAQPANDPDASALIDDLCRRLEQKLRSPHYAFRCELMRSGAPNAMALPGGFLFLSHSLLDLCERRPDELAFVIGHEMGHVVRGHAWDRTFNQTALQAVSVVASGTGPVGAWLRQQGMQLLLSAHSRDGEVEADELGVRLAAAAGFDPAGAISLLRQLERLGPDPSVLGQYFASHPPAAERIARLAPLCRKLAGKSTPTESSDCLGAGT